MENLRRALFGCRFIAGLIDWLRPLKHHVKASAETRKRDLPGSQSVRDLVCRTVNEEIACFDEHGAAKRF